MVPISSVTRRPMASRLGPSTTAMKSKGPVIASRWTIVEAPPLRRPSACFTDLVLPGAVSMRTYAFMPLRGALAMSHLRQSVGVDSEEAGEGGAERGRALDEPHALEIEPRAAVVAMVGGVEARG